jgi:regulatory protein
MQSTSSLDRKKALDRAQRLCSRQEKCIADVRQKLYQWGVKVDEMQGIIEMLIKDRFIDEQRFAINFAREKARFNKWGPKKIEMALRAKYILNEDIVDALTEIEDLVSMQTLHDILQKKMKTVKHTNTNDLRNKLIRFGLSRGFNYEKVAKVVGSII